MDSDTEKTELRIAVRVLVEHVLRSGDLELEFMRSSRPVEAIRAHQKIQKSRPDNYRAEFSLSHQFVTDQFVLTIGGRVDGIFDDPDRVVIEEIKTTTRNLDYYEQNENPLHWAQVKIYAYIYATQSTLAKIDAQLTYYHLDSGEMREIRRSYTTAELEVFFQDLVERYIQWAGTIIAWRQIRDESISDLNFPFETYRSGQREMAVAVYRTIQNGSQLLLQAATGIGKTMAAAFPAVKAIPEGLNSKIFYLTARTTARTVAEKALEEMRRKGMRLKSLTLTAKDKTCFNPESACNPEECEFARGHFDRIDDALAEIFRQDAFTRETVEQTARTYRVCPFEFALDLSLWADCVICDYNYAFDPRVYLRRFFQEEDGDYTFLIDEAHNLVDRSREMFSAQIFKQPILDVRRAVRKSLPRIFKSLGQINAWMVKARKTCEEAGTAISEKQPPEALYPKLRHFLKIAEHWLARDIKTAFREDMLELYFSISGFLRMAEQYDDSYETCYEKINKDLKVKLFCVDPSGHLKKVLNRCRTAVFFSATMTPMDYFHQILGCDDDAGHFFLQSPFPSHNFDLFISQRVSTLYRQREKTKGEVCRLIHTFIRQKRGNYLVFFPSYAYMTMVHELFKDSTDGAEIILQTREMAESERELFLEQFAHDNPKTLVGFAVMGGIFGEGIDLVGERLCGAAIVGVGLPGISLERDLIREYFQRTLNAGFEYAYLYPGINRVLQAAGRVIRTENDRGAVLLIDQRYGTYRYKSLLPQKWKPISLQNEQQLAEGLQRFWKEKR